MRRLCGPGFENAVARHAYQPRSAEPTLGGTRRDARATLRAMTRTDRASRVVNAPVSRVFDALVEREALETWLPPGDMTGRFERFDATPGGSYRLVLTYAEPNASQAKSSDDSDIVEVRSRHRSQRPGRAGCRLHRGCT